ncbi:MAG: type VI secretion system contractile sheath large subunit, partial [Thermodesulfobacteriota bacterium]
ERLLGRPRGEPAPVSPARPPGVDLSRFFQQVAAKHTVPGADPHRDVYLRAVDEAIGERMRALLHQPELQALEGLWRSVHGLVAELELDEDLQVFLLDATREELETDLRQAGPDLAGSALYRLLVDEGGPGAPGGAPWGVLVGDYAFGPKQADLELLAALGALASRAGGPFLARGRPELLGCRSLAETPDPRQWPPLEREAELRWQALRRSPAARGLGLLLPRVLLRLPYGRATDPVEGFAFEELGPARPHEAYLWGNPAFVAARLLGEAFRERGWDLEPGDRLEVGDLPAHVVEEAGEKVLVPCAEVYLGERAAEAVLGRGIMPLLSYRNRNAVRLARFQSLADPPAPLAGPWD